MIWDRLLRSAGAYWGAARSPKWSAVRRAFVRANPHCAACGTTKELEVHHVIPFHRNRDLELEPANLLTLCGDTCHLAFGHLFDWSSHNPSVREDANAWLAKVRSRP